MSVLAKFDLKGRRALVTGASRGLGREMAAALAEAGANLILVGRTPGTLQLTRDELLKFGGAVDIVSMDLENLESLPAQIENTIARLGPVDILINNVGGRRSSEVIHEQSLQSWQATLDRNVSSLFLMSSRVGAHMIARGRGGRIVNISSMNAFIANREIGNRGYETAKAAVLQFTRSAAADWAPYGITVNAICPGLFMTDANRTWQKSQPEMIDNIVSNIPLGRPGDPEEIAALALFLASPASSYVTGAAIVIDGGYTLW